MVHIHGWFWPVVVVMIGSVDLDSRWCGSSMAAGSNSDWNGEIISKAKACSTKGLGWAGVQRSEEARTGNDSEYWWMVCAWTGIKWLCIF